MSHFTAFKPTSAKDLRDKSNKRLSFFQALVATALESMPRLKTCLYTPPLRFASLATTSEEKL